MRFVVCLRATVGNCTGPLRYEAKRMVGYLIHMHCWGRLRDVEMFRVKIIIVICVCACVYVCV